MHLDEELRERLRHGELPPDEAARARTHLDACAECAAAVKAAADEEKRVDDLLAMLDAVPARRPRRARPRRTRLVASIAVVLVAAGVAWGLPGSPLRGLWTSIAGRDRAGIEAPPSGGVSPGAPAPAGIEVDPGSVLHVDFVPADDPVRVRIRLVDTPHVVVRGPAGSATFDSAPDRLTVRVLAPDASFELDVPAGAPRVELHDGGRTPWRTVRGRVTSEVMAAGERTYEIELAP